MPKLYTYFTPEEFGHFDHSFSQVFVIDILRATTTITTALINGADSVYPVAGKEEAMAFREKLVGKVWLAGERKGEKIPGFDKGNSPFEYMAGCSGVKIVMSTTNGTRALAKVNNFSEVFLLANINLKAVLERAANDNIAVLCSGSHGEFSLEDALTAGIFIRNLCPRSKWEFNDQSLAASKLAESLSDELFPSAERYLREIRKGIHSRRLIALGAEKDINYAGEFNKFSAVAKLDGKRVTLCS
jgi:2-phosphosulfolactate phosphatase